MPVYSTFKGDRDNEEEMLLQIASLFFERTRCLLQQLCQAISLNLRHERHVPGPRTTNHKHE